MAGILPLGDIVKWPAALVGERPLRIGYDSDELVD
jgi:hypothetical protein